jgi:replicative DNA helicase
MQKEQFLAPPSAVEVESAALAGILTNQETAADLLSMLKPEHFYRTSHRKIFQACLAAESIGNVDVVVVAQILRDSCPEISALELSKILDEMTAHDTAAIYKILNDKLTLRRIIEVSNAAIKRAFSNESAGETLDYIQQEAFKLTEHGEDRTKSTTDLIEEFGTSYEERFMNPQDVTGVPTGLDELDNLTSGLQGGDLVIIAARPSMGKTALALNFCRHAAKRGRRGCFYSIEQPSKQLFDRLMVMETGIDIVRLRTGRFEERRIPDINEAQVRLEGLPLFFDDDGSKTVNQICRHARKMERRHGKLDFICIDYLQLMRMAESRNSNRNNDIGAVTSQLKSFAKEMNIPVILLSQLSRELEKRSNKRPMLSDLRDSGNIEQDADVVMFIYRPGVYDEPEEIWGHTEIFVAKQRQGPTGTCLVQFVNDRMLFQNRPRAGTQGNFDDEK